LIRWLAPSFWRAPFVWTC